jgi:hypothetical protein
MGKKGRTPSVKARVGRTKQQFRKSKEGHFTRLTFLLLGFYFLISFFHLILFYSFVLHELICLSKSGFFWPEGAPFRDPLRRRLSLQLPVPLQTRRGDLQIPVISPGCGFWARKSSRRAAFY